MRTGPLAAVKAYCYWCCGDNHAEATLCPADECPIHPLRKGIKPKGFKKSIIKTIRERCIDCSGFEISEVRSCTHTECSLYPFRMGKNPNRSLKTYDGAGQEDDVKNMTVSTESSKAECNEPGEIEASQNITDQQEGQNVDSE